MTAQLLSVEVPFSSTGLKLGSSVGGPGASLATAGSVLFDSVGVMDIQSQGAFVGQTSAALSMLSAAEQMIHSQAKVELFAGGGISPTSCGPSGPVTAPDAGPPGATTEKVTGLVCAALSATSAGYDLKDAFAPNLAIEAPTATAKAIGVGVAGIAAFGGFSAVKAAAGGGGGGGPDIEERSATNIKMIAGKKIAGVAPAMISHKTPGLYEVKALLVTDFTTTLFSNFALAKFEVKSLDAFKTTSTKFEVEADAAVVIDTKDFKGKAKLITMDGHTKVTKVTEVKEKTTLKDDVQVDRNALLKGKLFVKGKTEVKGTLTVSRNTKIKQNTTVDGDVKTKVLEFKSRVTLGL